MSFSTHIYYHKKIVISYFLIIVYSKLNFVFFCTLQEIHSKCQFCQLDAKCMHTFLHTRSLSNDADGFCERYKNVPSLYL